jgi:uncharacterized membrane protein YhdT
MKHLVNNRRQGIVQLVILVIIAIIIIAYFKNDLPGILGSTRFKDALLTAISWIQIGLGWILDKLNWLANGLK